MEYRFDWKACHYLFHYLKFLDTMVFFAKIAFSDKMSRLYVLDIVSFPCVSDVRNSIILCCSCISQNTYILNHPMLIFVCAWREWKMYWADKHMYILKFPEYQQYNNKIICWQQKRWTYSEGDPLYFWLPYSAILEQLEKAILPLTGNLKKLTLANISIFEQ